MNARSSWKLLHVTPHLGGGVGRALVSLAEGDRLTGRRAPRRAVLCLERPRRTAAVERLIELGVSVSTLAEPDQLPRLAAAHDLVQFEVWNHPSLFAAWHRLRRTPLRMAFWCHVSGVSFPRLPQALWLQPFPVAVTAPCSLGVPDAALQAAVRRRGVRVISSAAGFEHWPEPAARPVRARRLRFGYLGSLNLSKMHPAYVDWVAAARQPWLRIEVLGEEIQPGWLLERCRAWRQPRLLRPMGYCRDVAPALARWDAMVYLLNPHHYGTAEIALLEAMASGVAPIVCDNPCERDIVEDGVTGCVVPDAAALAQAFERFRGDPAALGRLGRQACARVRERYTLARQSAAFAELYEEALAQPARVVDWSALLGDAPWQWFVATVPDAGSRPPFVPGRSPLLPQGAARYAHLEATKGSVHHFARHFPQDVQLRAWSQAVSRAAGPTLAEAA